VLAEQYRLLRAQAATAAATAAPAAPAWPPTHAAAQAAAAPTASAAAAPVRLHGRTPVSAAATFRSKRPGFWRRVKSTLLGSPEPVLEDSL